MRTRATSIRTFSGRRVWPLELMPQDVSIIDIAGALSQKCRYGGHTSKDGAPRHYSVAEHCVRLSDFASPKNRLAALIHDCAEAYLPDVTSPIKKQLVGFKEIEQRVEAAVVTALGLEHLYPWSAEVHELDHRILTDEMMELVPYGDWLADDGSSWYYGAPLGLPGHQLGWPAALAMNKFLSRYAELVQ